MSRSVAGRETGPIGLGCMGMTWAYGATDRDEAESIATIHRALELGVTLLDTADMYGPLTNEELVGRAITGRREEVVLATKCGLVVEDAGEYVLRRDGRPEHVRSAIEGSLRRLGTDSGGLRPLHPALRGRVTPQLAPAAPRRPGRALGGDLGRDGVARGAGQGGRDRHVRGRRRRVGARARDPPVASVQSEGSLWTRDAFAEVVPWCAEHGAAFLPFAPLGRGFLTGKPEPQRFPSGDFRKRNPRFQPEAMDANAALVETVKAVAARHDATPAQVALAWLLAQGQHVVPIPGTKRRTRLEENAAAGELRLTPDDLAELDALPEAVGSRY
jgi:aryl-alcohol dehydrogenase-like predicted oxidoreductase